MASARELIDLIRLLLDGDKIDVINYASIDNLLRKAGSSIDQVQMKEPFVAYRYDKQYRAQSLNQLYDEFLSVSKNSIEARFKETFSFTETFNSLRLMPIIGKSSRDKINLTPTHPQLVSELKDLKSERQDDPPASSSSSKKSSKKAPEESNPFSDFSWKWEDPPASSSSSKKPSTDEGNPFSTNGSSSSSRDPPKTTSDSSDYAPPPKSDRIPVSLLDFRDAFRVLGIPSTNDRSKIKERFKTLARESHPDKGKSTNPESFQAIKNAYDTIIRHLDSLSK
jgi:hypothetical protein